MDKYECTPVGIFTIELGDPDNGVEPGVVCRSS